jgi:Anti-sigma-K factor rskA
MGRHEEFRELCAVATAGELSTHEQAKLATHLTVCPDCRRAKSEYDAAAVAGVAALAESAGPDTNNFADASWSMQEAEERFFKRLPREERSPSAQLTPVKSRAGQRHSYRPAQIHWREIWMTFAAAILLTLALGVAAYRSGITRGTNTALKTILSLREPASSLEAQVSDAAYERSQLQAKLDASTKTIDDLKRQLAEQIRIVNSLKSTAAIASSRESRREEQEAAGGPDISREAELSQAQTKLAELQKAADTTNAQRDLNARQAAALEAKVNELTQLVRVREQALDEREADVAKGQELLEHDRDVRELMGARELYMADVHDVSGGGTEKTYGRIFYTKGKSLIFYAFDLDAQPGLQNAKSFQAWGRKGSDKKQARNLGIFYEDNASKKRWVLKADDPKSLEDIDAVFVTVEPHGGSQHPSGKQLLFASLRISPNHP